MNCKEAKEISIIEFLSEKGITPAKRENYNCWYLSPLRQENTPSFKVETIKNVWCDHGTGAGGTIVDLVCMMYKTDISGALKIISGSKCEPASLSFHQQKEKSNTLAISYTQTLKHPALLKYAESRGIPSQIAAKHTLEAHWEKEDIDTGRTINYFSIAFKNDHGGYELRSQIWKGCTVPKFITTIPGNDNNNIVNVFEGFFDYLSALVYYKIIKSKHTTIVLNSTKNLHNIMSILQEFGNINLFLDNDSAGTKAANEIQTLYPAAVNQSKLIYPGYKDFNDFITEKK